MVQIEILRNRIKDIKLGQCLPSHLYSDYESILKLALESFKEARVSSIKQKVVNDLITEVNEILSKDYIIRNNKYGVVNIEYEINNGEIKHGMIEVVDEEDVDEYITCDEAMVNKVEAFLQKELGFYKDGLSQLILNKSLKNQLKKSIYRKPSTLFLNRELAANNAYHLSKLQVGTKLLFLNYPKQSKEIQEMLLSQNPEEFSENPKKIELGISIKLAAYIFHRLSKGGIITKRYQAFFEKTRSIYCEESAQPITANLMSAKLSLLLNVPSTEKLSEPNIKMEDICKDIDKELKRCFLIK